MKTGLLMGWAVAALAAMVGNAKTTLEVCSDNNFGIKDVKLPDVVVAGEKVSIEVTQVPNKYVGKGKIHVDLLVEGIRAHSETYDLCAVTQCHVTPHLESRSAFDFHIPFEIPKGFNVELRIVVNDHNGAALTCVDVSGVPEVEKKFAEVELRATVGDLSLSKSELEFLFNRWADEYGMRFAAHEIKEKMRVFADNLESIALHNNKKDVTYKLAMNEFGHMTHEEFSSTHFGFNGSARNATHFRPLHAKINKSFYQLEVDTESLGLPEEVDWVKKGAVTDVKNQGACGSCWSFSATGALEGAYFLKTGKLVSFSEQELVTCDNTGMDQGCNGGLMDYAFQFMEKHGGLCTEQDYPYVSGAGSAPRACKKCTAVEGSAPTSIKDIQHTQSSLEEAVSQQPVAIAIEADQMSFQFYKSGVLTGTCSNRLDHGVLAVGYGTLNGVKYWKVKNSWGPNWGMNGYVLIQRGKTVSGGECGILMSASYPVL